MFHLSRSFPRKQYSFIVVIHTHTQSVLVFGAMRSGRKKDI